MSGIVDEIFNRLAEAMVTAGIPAGQAYKSKAFQNTLPSLPCGVIWPLQDQFNLAQGPVGRLDNTGAKTRTVRHRLADRTSNWLIQFFGGSHDNAAGLAEATLQEILPGFTSTNGNFLRFVPVTGEFLQNDVSGRPFFGYELRLNIETIIFRDRAHLLRGSAPTPGDKLP